MKHFGTFRSLATNEEIETEQIEDPRGRGEAVVLVDTSIWIDALLAAGVGKYPHGTGGSDRKRGCHLVCGDSLGVMGGGSGINVSARSFDDWVRC